MFWGLGPEIVGWVLGIVSWVLGFVFWVSGIVFEVSGIVFWVLGIVFWVSGFVFWVLGIVFWVQIIGATLVGRGGPIRTTGRLHLSDLIRGLKFHVCSSNPGRQCEQRTLGRILRRCIDVSGYLLA